MKERHFLKCTMINFSEIRRQQKEKENDEYTKVLKDIGIDVEDPSVAPLDSLPLFTCIVDMADISQVSPLTREENKGFIQIDYRSGQTNYIRGRFDVLQSIVEKVGTVHDFE